MYPQLPSSLPCVGKRRELHREGKRRSDQRRAGYASGRNSSQEITLIHVIFECLFAVDEDDGDFVAVLTAELVVGVDVNFAPAEAAMARKLAQRLLHHLAKVAALARIQDDIAESRHRSSLT